MPETWFGNTMFIQSRRAFRRARDRRFGVTAIWKLVFVFVWWAWLVWWVWLVRIRIGIWIGIWIGIEIWIGIWIWIGIGIRNWIGILYFVWIWWVWWFLFFLPFGGSEGHVLVICWCLGDPFW